MDGLDVLKFMAAMHQGHWGAYLEWTAMGGSALAFLVWSLAFGIQMSCVDWLKYKGEALEVFQWGMIVNVILGGCQTAGQLFIVYCFLRAIF